MIPLPPLVLRWLRLFEARRAILDGAPERALGVLRDPLLALSGEAALLRARALEVLYRSAASRRAQGREGSVARILAVIAGEDPERARLARAELAAATAPRAEAPSRLRGLLAQMRGEGAVQGSTAAARSPSLSSPTTRSAAALPAPSAAPAVVRRFHLAIDDGGEFLALLGARLVVGHARAGKADLPLLADLESEHAELSLCESFHAGPSWVLRPIGEHTVRVGGVLVGAEGAVLSDGAEIELASNARMRFRLPERASSTAILELLHGLESEGVARVLCFAPRTAGRVRIGPHVHRHVTVAGLEHEVVLLLDSDALTVSCAGGVHARDSGEPAAVELRVLQPLSTPLDLVVNARPSQRLPFGITLRPIEGLERP
jgi:hypothetical protein